MPRDGLENIKLCLQASAGPTSHSNGCIGVCMNKPVREKDCRTWENSTFGLAWGDGRRKIEQSRGRRIVGPGIGARADKIGGSFGT